ncbi:hypothetical protein ACNQVK_01250 [Mycobacterium sp. 134]|uniref:hypothetical protein n=1 Tax=Mycobacterium sp. 134 TaxID=3400425 RepID=UPI003AACFD72
MALHIPWEIVDQTTCDELEKAQATNVNRRSGYHHNPCWDVDTAAAATDSLLDHLAAA